MSIIRSDLGNFHCLLSQAEHVFLKLIRWSISQQTVYGLAGKDVTLIGYVLSAVSRRRQYLFLIGGSLFTASGHVERRAPIGYC